ncbi:MAG: hypothetical protein J6Y37_06740, partial [Paludibacteraceae bacterium]|nr:hypothetical protein [Paludibacteraceae bacterium]
LPYLFLVGLSSSLMSHGNGERPSLPASLFIALYSITIGWFFVVIQMGFALGMYINEKSVKKDDKIRIFFY